MTIFKALVPSSLGAFHLTLHSHGHTCADKLVIRSGFVNAARLSSEASGRPLNEQRILFFGAGSAGVGVATQLTSFFMLQGMTEDEARAQIWTVDSQGLITADRKNLAAHKKCKNLSPLVRHNRRD